MRVDALHLQGWRNYGTQALTFDPSCNVIYGENAQGKTNLLEAIVYLSCGKSPRAHGDKELIGFDMQEAALLGDIFSRQREFVTDIRLFRGKRRKMTVNGVPAKNSAALSDVLHTVFFAPEDLFLIRAGAAERRRFMDLSLCQLRPRYAEALSQYSRLYEHKTRILRDSEDKPELLDLLPEFNEGLCRSGAVLVGYRARFCAVLAEYARQAHYECSGEREELTLTYQTVRTVADPLGSQADIYAALAAHMESHQAAERASKLCLSGAHKDDIEVLVNGRSARQFCSQGQVRTAALSLKLAEREIHKNAMGEYPVMLLDDVLSELDPRRQEYVLNRISGGQVFPCAGRGGTVMAYLHIGMNVMVEDRRVIGIFDLDNTSTSKKTREFLQGAEQEGVVQSACEDIPRSFVVCDHPYHRQIVYLSQINSRTLGKRVQGKGE
mgnify:CR=1 FL=1